MRVRRRLYAGKIKFADLANVTFKKKLQEAPPRVVQTIVPAKILKHFAGDGETESAWQSGLPVGIVGDPVAAPFHNQRFP